MRSIAIAPGLIVGGLLAAMLTLSGCVVSYGQLAPGMAGAVPIAGDEDLAACTSTEDGPACQEPDGGWALVDDFPRVGFVGAQDNIFFYRRGVVHFVRRRHLSRRAARALAARWHPQQVRRAAERVRIESRGNVARFRGQATQRGFPPHQVRQPAYYRPQPARPPQYRAVRPPAPQYRVVRPAPRREKCLPGQRC